MVGQLAVRFTDEAEARKHLEALHWPEGPVCPHCGVVDEASSIKGGRKGLWFCNACRKQFSVTVGTVMERSKIPLNTWLYATHLLCSSKKGISAHQLSRMLGVTYKTAWFLAHRIREAMKPASNPQFGAAGQAVEIDEAFIGQKPGVPKSVGAGHKHVILSLVERGGPVRSFHVPNRTYNNLHPLIEANVSRKANLRTDEAQLYRTIGWNFASHETVNHESKEWTRGSAHTNTVEGVFSIFKRGMVGTYQHCGEQHLHRYLAEFDFRYSNRISVGVDDTERADRALKGAVGKRLTYRRTTGHAA